MVRVYYSLYDRMLSVERLTKGFLKVKSAKGAVGVDGQSIEEFAVDLEENIARLAKELREKSYQPLPVKRVEIPKAGGGKRKLGIPSVRDRVVQQVLLDILQPIFDPEFHPSSYAYRPGRSCHQAIAKAALFIREYDLCWVVDMDISKCFDRTSWYSFQLPGLINWLPRASGNCSEGESTKNCLLETLEQKPSMNNNKK